MRSAVRCSVEKFIINSTSASEDVGDVGKDTLDRISGESDKIQYDSFCASAS